MRISDWSSDVCSSDLQQIQIADRIENLVADKLVVVAQAVVVDDAKIVERHHIVEAGAEAEVIRAQHIEFAHEPKGARARNFLDVIGGREINDRILTGILEHRMLRSEEHTSELQSLMRISYSDFFL